MTAHRNEPASPRLQPATDSDSGSSVDTMLASALQRNMSFTEDRKRQHTPGTANRPRRLRKAEGFDCDDLKENCDPVAPSTKKVTPSRLACIKQLEQEMTCSVCLDICVRPCTTPCGHDFCRKCLKQALQHQRRCPKCRTQIATSAPICINTVLWNTIKLLFPKHAANAPESPADAILTPSSANNTALVANAVAALPMRRIGLIHAPYNPPRRVHAHSPQQRLPRGAQRGPPSWLEGATRDSDPPASNPRHRLALSSQQQTLPQALGRWENQAGRAHANGANAETVAQQSAAVPGGHPANQHHNAGLMQRTRNALANRNAMPSLLDNLQQRLDDLPVPHILHGRPHSQPAQEVAAGLEASPRLRVRAFPSQPQPLLQPQQQPASAARPFVRPQRLPSTEGQGTSRQPLLAACPAWNHPHADAPAPAVRGSVPASDAWLLDLPGTPEAPRAAAVTERQALADALFEEAAGQSAVADSEALSEDPSWLEDAAAYDAAAAEADDDLSALEILSDDDDDDTPINGARSQARLNLSQLEHLMLMSDSEEEDEGMSEVEDPAVADRQAADGGSEPSLAARLLSGHAEALPPHASANSGQVQGMDRHNPDAQSGDELAVGHDGQARVVLSDVTSHFPTEQLPQQVPDDAANKPEEAAGVFQLQRRSRQPRACRSIQAPEDSESATSNVLTSLQGGSSSVPASSDTQAATAGRPALRSSARLLQAEAPTAPNSEAASEGAISDGQAGICTRRQAKLNKQPSQHSSQHNLSQENVSSDDDFAVVSRSQRQGRVLNHAGGSHPAATQLPGCPQVVNGDAQTDVAEKPFAMRRNRPRLQLNRKAKGINDMGSASQAAAAPITYTSSTSQQ